MSAPAHDCAAALLIREGKLLLGHRAPDRAWLPGAWDVFGGHIEAGETPEAAARREAFEELGIVVTRLRPLAILTAAAGGSWRLHLFVADAWEGEPRLREPREHVELRWCTLSEAQQRLAAAHPEVPRVLAQALQSAS